jgi:Na+-driven multidrug efflux pump
MEEKKLIFEKVPVPKAVAKLALPTVMSMLVTILYNMVDTYFVGQTGDPNQVAAVSIATPAFFVLMALGNIFGIGGGSYISRLLGEGRPEKAKYVSSFSFYGAAAVGIVLVGVFLLGMPFILRVIGSDEYTAGFAEEYLKWSPWARRSLPLQPDFPISSERGLGESRDAGHDDRHGHQYNTGPDHDIDAAHGRCRRGIATVIGNCAALAYYVIYFLKSKTILSISRRTSGCPTGSRRLSSPSAFPLPSTTCS